MEVNIDGKDNLIEKSLRDLIFGKAIEQIIKELTPERLELFAAKWLEESLRYMNFYDARKPLQEYADKFLKAYVMRPENLERIEEACRRGFEEIIANLPGAIYEKHQQRVLEAFEERRR